MTGGEVRATGRRRRSLRWRLATTYAGVALLTALVLGGVLVAMLEVHFSQREMDHLRKAADQAARDVRSAGTTASLAEVARVSAFGLQTRVQLYDAAGRLVADSGSPGALKAQSLAGSSGGAGTAAAPAGDKPASAAPQGRSDKVIERQADAGSPGGVTRIRVSEAPAEGTSIMGGVLAAWAAAAAVAVAIAALAGYALSTRIARPVVELTVASERVAHGDLGARADVREDGELGRLASSFNLMAERVESTVSMLRRFVSDEAHQLGTPLTALRADLEIAQDPRTGDEERRRLIARALGQERRLEELGDKLLQLSRLESPARAVQMTDVDVGELARSVADTFASRLEQADIDLDLDVAAGPLHVRADAGRLALAIENLVENAAKFTPPGGRIVIEARREASDVLIAVSDTGPGVPAADRQKVFERFYRAPSAAGVPGSGLGLAIVQAAIETCGGSVLLAPADAGARFEVRIPA